MIEPDVPDVPKTETGAGTDSRHGGARNTTLVYLIEQELSAIVLETTVAVRRAVTDREALEIGASTALYLFELLKRWGAPGMTIERLRVAARKGTERRTRMAREQEVARLLDLIEATHEGTAVPDGGLVEDRRPIEHGVTCEKKPHAGRRGHLHDRDDDRPFDVDGVSYCGRCHEFLS